MVEYSNQAAGSFKYLLSYKLQETEIVAVELPGCCSDCWFKKKEHCILAGSLLTLREEEDNDVPTLYDLIHTMRRLGSLRETWNGNEMDAIV